MHHLRRLQAEQPVLFWVLVALGLFLGFQLALCRGPAAQTARAAVVGAHRGRRGWPRPHRPEPAEVPVSTPASPRSSPGAPDDLLCSGQARRGAIALDWPPTESVLLRRSLTITCCEEREIGRASCRERV